MSAASGSPVRAERLEDGTLLRIVLDRPKANILDTEMMAALSAALDEAAGDPRLRAVAIQGAGDHFSYGASVAEHVKERAPEMLGAFSALCRKLAAYPIPLLAFVQGRCLGGAFEVVLCCHIVLATDTAVFGCPEIKLGVFPPVLAAIGRHRLGGAVAERLLLTGANLSAEEAVRAGLVAEVVNGGDPDEALLFWFRGALRPLSAFSLRQAVAASREHSALLGALGGRLDRAEKVYLERVLPSHDGNEGIEAFLERRAPTWKDR